MYSSDARMVRGLSIAVIILSSLAIAGMLVVVFFLGVGGAALNDPFVLNEIAINSDPATINELNHYNIDASDVAAIGSFAVGIGVAMSLGVIACCAVTLVAGILGLRRHGQPDKIGAAFGWSIAGAIAALLTGRIVSVVLLVVMAVYLNKLRNPAPAPAYAAPYPGQPAAQPYAAPYPAQPYHPTQPYQPQAPQPPAPQQPEAPQPPVPPEQQ